MGIKGLWAALKPFVQDGHLGQFHGQRVAVDMYVWLHMAIKDCIIINEEKLATYFVEKRRAAEDGGRARDTTASTASSSSPPPSVCIEDVVTLSSDYIVKIVSRIESLQRFGIIPVCVFDGADIPMKKGTNLARGERRVQCFTDALAQLEANYFSSGDGFQPYAATYTSARELLERAVDISAEVAHPIIQVLKEERHLECIVAPYEADAQLAYLAQTGHVKAALSEDSDLIAYYCPCVIAKVDFFTGRCAVLLPPQSIPSFFLTMSATAVGRRQPQGSGGGDVTSGVTATISAPSSSARFGASDSKGGTTTLPGFTYESFLLGCVMSGCDYVPNLRRIGIKTAFKMVSHAQSLAQVLGFLQDQYGFPAETVQTYRRHVCEAFYCFAHHLVYCPRRQRVVSLHPLPAALASRQRLKCDLIGDLWSEEVAQKVCGECLFDPTTLKLYLGTYQPALQEYLHRVRRGQTSLTSFKGFSGMASPKVVVMVDGPGSSCSGGKRGRDHAEPAFSYSRGTTTGREDNSVGHGRHLRKVQVAHGFLGSGGGSPAVVRSKYFLRGGGGGDDWSRSSSSSSSSRASSLAREGSREGGESQSASPLEVPEAAVTPHGLSSLATSDRTTGPEQATTVGPPPAKRPECLCPFGSVECGSQHSIFVQCSAGKGGTRGRAPGGGEVEDAEADEMTSMDDSPSSVGTSTTAGSDVVAAQRRPATYPTLSAYQCAGFKPPRSLGHSAAGERRQGPSTLSTSASIFDTLAFKRS